MQELSIIQRTYDLIVWYVPLLNKLPRDQKFILGDRIQNTLYDFLEGLLRARYSREKAAVLEGLNASLDILRYQTRLCRDFKLMDMRRYEFATGHMNEIGKELGGWLRQARQKAESK